jgi:hypothetical protein
MTVKELITELETLNPNAIIIVANDDLYLNGAYEATIVDYVDDYDKVEIRTDYKRLVIEEE